MVASSSLVTVIASPKDMTLYHIEKSEREKRIHAHTRVYKVCKAATIFALCSFLHSPCHTHTHTHVVVVTHVYSHIYMHIGDDDDL